MSRNYDGAFIKPPVKVSKKTIKKMAAEGPKKRSPRKGEPPNRSRQARAAAKRKADRDATDLNRNIKRQQTPEFRASATSKESAKRMTKPGSVTEAGAASGAFRVVGSLVKTGKLPKKGPKSSVKNYDPRRASKKKKKKDLEREKQLKRHMRGRIAQENERRMQSAAAARRKSDPAMPARLRRGYDPAELARRDAAMRRGR